MFALQTAKKVKIHMVRYQESDYLLGKKLNAYDGEELFVKESDAIKFLEIQGYQGLEKVTGSLKTTAKIIPKIIYKYV